MRPLEERVSEGDAAVQVAPGRRAGKPYAGGAHVLVHMRRPRVVASSMAGRQDRPIVEFDRLRIVADVVVFDLLPKACVVHARPDAIGANPEHDAVARGEEFRVARVAERNVRLAFAFAQDSEAGGGRFEDPLPPGQALSAERLATVPAAHHQQVAGLQGGYGWLVNEAAVQLALEPDVQVGAVAP